MTTEKTNKCLKLSIFSFFLRRPKIKERITSSTLQPGKNVCSAITTHLHFVQLTLREMESGVVGCPFHGVQLFMPPSLPPLPCDVAFSRKKNMCLLNHLVPGCNIFPLPLLAVIAIVWQNGTTMFLHARHFWIFHQAPLFHKDFFRSSLPFREKGDCFQNCLFSRAMLVIGWRWPESTSYCPVT